MVQTRAANVTFTQGKDALACMRLTPKGLLRWYAACCNTPVGNTLASSKISFVGLVHSCLEGGGTPLIESFGPVRAHVNTESTRGKVTSSTLALVSVILRFMALVARAYPRVAWTLCAQEKSLLAFEQRKKLFKRGVRSRFFSGAGGCESQR